MIRDRRKEKLYLLKDNNSGSALITVLVVGIVMMVLCLSLLFVSYSLFATVNEQDIDMPRRELVNSLAVELEQELKNVECSYKTQEEMVDFYESEDNNFWKYVRYNLWQGWPLFSPVTPGEPGGILPGSGTQNTDPNAGYWIYYNKNEAGHDNLEACSRYFRFDTADETQKIVVQLYWELPEDYSSAAGMPDKNGTILHAVYRLYEGEEVSYKTSRSYILGISEVPPVTINQYEVSFDMNGIGNSEDAPAKQNVDPNGKVTKPESVAEPAGYDFAGWYKTPGCEPENEWDFENDLVNTNIILYAKWEKESYTVTYHNPTGPGTADFFVTREYNEPAGTYWAPSYEGYNFGGWYTDLSFTNLFDFSTAVKSNIDVYAKWTPIEYCRVTFMMNKSAIDSNIYVTKDVIKGTTVEPPAISPADGKRGFVGWYTSASGADSELWDFARGIVNSDLVLYARWTTGYAIEFVANNPDITSSFFPYVVDVAKSDKVSEPEPPIDDNYIFAGWYRDPEYIHPYVFHAAITNSHKIYAKWVKKSYQMSADIPAGPVLTTLADADGPDDGGQDAGAKPGENPDDNPDGNPDGGADGNGGYVYLVSNYYIPGNLYNPDHYVINPREVWRWQVR